MIIFISPAKGFNETEKEYSSLPLYEKEAKSIVSELKKYTLEDLGKVLKTNEKLTNLNYERYENFSFDENISPAIFSYDGIQYKSMNLHKLEDEEIEFLNNHLRIISGLYGILKPLDGIKPYRLEMQTKLKIDKYKNLYDFWGDKIYKILSKESSGVIVNLASLEYSKGITKYIKDEIYVECIFKVKKGDELKVQSTASKKARGMMIYFIGKNRIKNYEDLKKFNLDGYSYREDLSEINGDKIKYIFVKE